MNIDELHVMEANPMSRPHQPLSQPHLESTAHSTMEQTRSTRRGDHPGTGTLWSELIEQVIECGDPRALLVLTTGRQVDRIPEVSLLEHASRAAGGDELSKTQLVCNELAE